MDGFRLAVPVAVSDGSQASALSPIARSANPAAVESLMGAIKFRARRSPEDFATALEEARSFAAQCPTLDNTFNQWAQAAAMMGMPEEAIAAGRRAREISPATTQMHVGLLLGLIAAGRTQEATALLAELRAAPIPVPPPLLAPAVLQLGDRAGAIALLEQARRAKCLHFLVADFDPRLEELARDPGLAPLWQEVRAARASVPLRGGRPVATLSTRSSAAGGARGTTA